MDRKGERVRFNSYEKPISRVLEGVVLKSGFDDSEDGFGWWHSIDSDEKFITNQLGEKHGKILRTESELLVSKREL